MKKWLKEHLKLPTPKPLITDETIRELGLIGFFCMFGTGLWQVYPPLSLIICGLLGMWFFIPRGR